MFKFSAIIGFALSFVLFSIGFYFIIGWLVGLGLVGMGIALYFIKTTEY